MSNQARSIYRRTSLAGFCRPRAVLPLKMLVGALVAGCSSAPAVTAAGSGATAAASRPAASATVAKPTAGARAGLAGTAGQVYKILVIVEENHSIQQVSPGGMPYLWSLAQRYAYATDWSDVAHPSLPNYLAIFAGSAFNDPQDCAPAPGCGYPGPSVFGHADSATEVAPLLGAVR